MTISMKPRPYNSAHSFLIALFLALVPFTGAAQENPLATGVFKTKSSGIDVSGKVEIRKESGKFLVVLQDDFKSSGGPDLYVALSPKTFDVLKNDNAKDGALRIKPLEKTAGKQTYDLGETLDLNQYKTVIIHCWQYSHLYGAATLEIKPAPTSIAFGCCWKPLNARSRLGVVPALVLPSLLLGRAAPL